MADPTTRLAKTADARPDANTPAPSTLPDPTQTPLPAQARYQPATTPALHRDDPRPGDDSDVLHVVPTGSTWTVKIAGAGAAVAVAPTKEKAVNAAKNVARERQLRVVIHRADGSIQRSHDYA